MAKRKAYTLVELIITTAVVVMMLAVTLPAFINFQKDQNLLTGASFIRDAVLEATNYALAPRSDEQGGGKIAGADYYRVVFELDPTGNSVVKVEEQKNVGLAIGPSLEWQTLKTTILPNGVAYCQFSPLTLEQTAPPDPTTGIIYSISQLGRIVSPATAGKLSILLKHRALATGKQIEIQAETGQINVLHDQVLAGC